MAKKTAGGLQLEGRIKLKGKNSGKHVDCEIRVSTDEWNPDPVDVGQDRTFRFAVPKDLSWPALVTVRPGICKLGADSYRAIPPAQTFQFDPREINEPLVISYEPVPAEIRLTLGPDVRVELFRGPTTSKLVRTAVTSDDHREIVFADLDPGVHTVVTTSASTGGRTKATRQLKLMAGDVLELDYDVADAKYPLEVRVTTDDGTPVEDVTVVVRSQHTGDEVEDDDTDGDGSVDFDVAAGSYAIDLATDAVNAVGHRWTMAGPPVVVTVGAEQPGAVVQLSLVLDEPLIHGSVLDNDDKPVPNVRLVARSHPDGAELADFASDKDGHYTWSAPAPGIYSISYKTLDGQPERLTPVYVNSPEQFDVRLWERDYPYQNGNAPRSGSQPFPLLVSSVDIGGGGGGARSGGVATGQSGQLVESALKDVLGWRPRSQDPRGFVAALSQAFTSTEVAGHTEVSWTPRSYAASIQADLGALTGAQASIYQQANLLVTAALTILDRIRPLLPDPDPEDVAAVRAIVRSRLEEIPKELGAEGGPRVQRVDQLFLNLVGNGVVLDPATVAGELGRLRLLLGMTREKVNTLEEEHEYTEFLMLVGHVGTLFSMWKSQRGSFDRISSPGEHPFLGTQLVLLSRQLEVVAETVGETYFAMDSVFLGAAERQTVPLAFGDTESPMTIAELLDWVEQFATVEGPRLISDGGKAGVRTFAPTARRLEGLVAAALITQPGAPPSYHEARVQQALQQLRQQLQRAADLAQAIQ